MRKLRILVLVVVGVFALLAVATATLDHALSQGPIEARVLVWESTPDDDGYLAALTTGGAEDVLVDFPPGLFANWAKRCGQDSWAKDGKSVAIYTGAARGAITLFPLEEGGATVALGETNRMACAGPASFQFSPNQERVGYIDYARDAIDREFPYGDLRFYDAASGTALGTFDWATAFTLYDDGALMLRFFPDGKGNATEADVDWWDGAARRTLVTLEPVYPPDKEDIDCTFKAGSVARIKDTAYVLTGQWCETGASNWRLVSIPLSGGEVKEIGFGQPGGGYFSESFTTNLFPAQDGSGFLMTMPSGLSRNTVRLQWITHDGAITPLLENQHVVADRFEERLSEGRLLMVAPDGKTLAFVTATANGEQTLWVIDLNTTGGQPVQLEDLGINQRVFQHVWTKDNRLYFVAGSIESNALFVATPDGTSQRLERGRFFRVTASYDGSKLALAEWFANPNSIGDDLFRLVLMDTNGNKVTLKEGGPEHNKMIPLAIR